LVFRIQFVNKQFVPFVGNPSLSDGGPLALCNFSDNEQLRFEDDRRGRDQQSKYATINGLFLRLPWLPRSGAGWDIRCMRDMDGQEAGDAEYKRSDTGRQLATGIDVIR
jgi:hypothetical protein